MYLTKHTPYGIICMRSVVMIYTELTKKAMQLAYNAHHGAYDKGGMPYFHHPLHLAEQMTTEEEAAAALLHDVIEDTDITAEELISHGIPLCVVEAVVLLTKPLDDNYFDYVRHVAENPIAKKVKLADLMHNSDISRISDITEADLARLKKYKKALEILMNE